MSHLAKPGFNLEAASLEGRPVVNIQLPADEWPFALTAHPNLLLEGDVAATAIVIAALAPHLGQPIDCWAGKPPACRPATLLVREVAAMDAADQQLLMQWLDSPGERVHVVATSSKPLFPLVLRGAFMEDLYYRINVLRFEV